MTTRTNGEGNIITYTNELLETILSRVNSSNTYYTTGDDDVLFIEIGSNITVILDYAYHINRNVVQNYTINEHAINDCSL